MAGPIGNSDTRCAYQCNGNTWGSSIKTAAGGGDRIQALARFTKCSMVRVATDECWWPKKPSSFTSSL